LLLLLVNVGGVVELCLSKPLYIQQAIYTVLLIRSTDDHNILVALPNELMLLIFERLTA
jgi:hypothetical protein